MTIGFPNDRHDTVRNAERGLHRFGNAVSTLLRKPDAVDDELDGVFFLLLEAGSRLEIHELFVDSGPQKSLLQCVFEHFPVFALLSPNHRGEHLQFGAARPRQDDIENLIHALLADLAPAGRTVRHADARKQEAQIIVNFRDGPHGRARIARRRLLLDGNRGRKPLDIIHIGLVHPPQKLSGIGRKRFDIAALTLGKDRVEGERALPRAR